jgi:hypothetical protein
MMEYLDGALDYLSNHKLIAASVALLFFALLIKNFWFLIKLIVALAIAVVLVFLAYNFISDTIKKKEEFLQPSNSSLAVPLRLHVANRYDQRRRSPLTPITNPSSFRRGQILSSKTSRHRLG